MAGARDVVGVKVVSHMSEGTSKLVAGGESSVHSFPFFCLFVLLSMLLVRRELHSSGSPKVPDFLLSVAC